jgi:acyl carrier protein
MTVEPEREMTFEEFQAVLAEELMLSTESLTREASLIDDLHVDSLALASMMLRLEEMGVALPLESAWEIQTVDDAYQVYLDSVRSASDHD